MVNVLQEMPGHGPFIAKNSVEAALNAVHLSSIATADLGPNSRAVMRGYLADPVAWAWSLGIRKVVLWHRV